MVWKINDFECGDCGHIFEEMYRTDEFVLCPECESTVVTKLISATNIGAFSAMSAEQQKQSLMHRSATHTQKQLNKEPERFGPEGVARAEKKTQVGYTADK